MFLHKRLCSQDIIRKSNGIAEVSMIYSSLGDMNFIITFGESNLSYEQVWFDEKIDCLYLPSASGKYVVFGENNEGIMYGVYFYSNYYQTFTYLKETNKMNYNTKKTIGTLKDIYVYVKQAEDNPKFQLDYFIKSGAISEGSGVIFEERMIRLYHTFNENKEPFHYYKPQFGISFPYSAGVKKITYYNIGVGYNTDDFGGIDLSLDTRPIHYIDEDGSAIQLVTERCIKNPSAFDMNAKEINVDDTRLITKDNLKSEIVTLENKANTGCVTVGYVDEVLPYAKYNHLKI